jgi:SPRY domain.
MFPIFSLSLPFSLSLSPLPPLSLSRQPLVKFKCHLYYEEKDKVTEALKRLQTLDQSQIVFYKNGKSQGVAFQDIYAGYYYPCVSLHKNCTVSVNFGPHFKHALPTEEFPNVRGVSTNEQQTDGMLARTARKNTEDKKMRKKRRSQGKLKPVEKKKHG